MAKILECKFFACNTKKVIVTLWLGQNTNNCKVENCQFDMQNAFGLQHNEPSHVYTITDSACSGIVIGNRLKQKIGSNKFQGEGQL